MHMLIKQKRVGNIDRYTKMIKPGATIRVGIGDISHFTIQLQRAGFSPAMSAGETILPTVIGPVSLYNAEGREIIHKDQPKETCYRQVEWHWEEWHGPYTIPQSKIVDVPYERYPRTPLLPPSVEMTICQTISSGTIVVGPEITYSDANKESLTHVVNLFLEVFGECQFFTADLNQIIKVPIKRLNWQLLPPGERPWALVHRDLQPVISRAPKGNQVVIEHRLETINQYGSDFAAIGRGGFQGYVVLGFIGRQLFVLESLMYGNATYVLGQNWEDISKLTKAEILREDLQKVRLIHREGWERKIHELLAVRQEENKQKV
jgi:hypothetical protein